MKLGRMSVFLFLLFSSLILVGCSQVSANQPAAIAASLAEESPEAMPLPTETEDKDLDQNQPESQFWVEEVPRVDEQGAVVVEITPLNLSNPGSTLDFLVSLDTHSVDLSMDLAAMATLVTDTGYTLQATEWNAPVGGHHVSGKLLFPAAVDGTPLLNGVKKLTITLVDVDVPERTFVWEK